MTRLAELAQQAVQEVKEDIEAKDRPLLASRIAVAAIKNMVATLATLSEIVGFSTKQAEEEFKKLGVKPETAHAFAEELAASL